MVKMSLIKIALAGMVYALPLSIAQAQAPKALKQHKAWGAYSYNDKRAGTICYILSIPTAKEPRDRNHGDVFFLVSQKPDGSKKFEPQVEVGYPLKASAGVTVTIDGKTFDMFSKGNNAWVKDISQEPVLIDAMRSGKTMKVIGQSSRGTQTSYTYSLAGVTAALNEAKKCK